jgi:late competence protein required for DNA uptake (superfamily II DNA/RNA helicase)
LVIPLEYRILKENKMGCRGCGGIYISSRKRNIDAPKLCLNCIMRIHEGEKLFLKKNKEINKCDICGLDLK